MGVCVCDPNLKIDNGKYDMTVSGWVEGRRLKGSIEVLPTAAHRSPPQSNKLDWKLNPCQCHCSILGFYRCTKRVSLEIA